MKTRILISFAVLTVFQVTTLRAQDELGTLISESIEDTESATKAYGGPFLKAIGTDFNTGWVNTGEPMAIGQFDVRLVGTAAFAPKDDWSFRPADYDLDEAEKGGLFTNAETLPTIFGDATNATIEARATSQDGTEVETKSNIPIETLGVRGAPMLMPQLNIGFYKGTQLMIRGLPPVNMPSYEELQRLKTSYWAIGLQHDIKQWIPGLKVAPFSWSVYFAYSNASMSLGGPFYTFEMLNENYYANSGEYLEQPPALPDYDAQSLEFDTKGVSIGTIVSKQFSVLTIFGGLEYNASNTEVVLLGKYPYINYDEEVMHLPGEEGEDELMSITEETGQMGINGGLRLKLWIFSMSLSGTYVLDGYSSGALSLGVGLFD